MNVEHVTNLLVAHQMLDQNQASDIMEAVNTSEKSIAQVLTEYGLYGDESEFYSFIAADLGVQFYSLEGFTPPEEVIRMIPMGTARLHGALPVTYDHDGLHVALIDPMNPQTPEDLRFALDKEIVVVVAPEQRIEELISECYSSEIPDLTPPEADPSGTLSPEEAANSAPIVEYVNKILYQGVKAGASDIHFEPFEKEFKIRYRVDGALMEMDSPQLELAMPLISRIKVISDLNIAERRLPQDGRIMQKIGDTHIDLRVSCLPTVHGESVVLRVLDRSSINLDLPQLGLSPELHEYIEDTIRKPNGIFIVTGPTGAGKTTTLYAALRKINTEDTKILTAEDPVEYDVDGIIQVPVNEAIGLTFSRILRAFLRQDPDRILVGEMRDVDTAQIAVQASLTGHLVLSTLHTNDAAGAVTRLVEMGTEPFLVAATLEAVLAQRLVRKICSNCRVPYQPNEQILSQLDLTYQAIGDKVFYTGNGCSTCGDTGYKGRKGLYELLDITDPIRDMITQKKSTVVLKEKAIELGMKTLREDGLQNIYEGNTTIEEVLKYT